ncbi:hypothetical protein KJ840_01840 [Patescibacteria group bacterium]|nr:hypothetical protein [Patescibacteria group bacterium]
MKTIVLFTLALCLLLSGCNRIEPPVVRAEKQFCQLENQFWLKAIDSATQLAYNWVTIDTLKSGFFIPSNCIKQMSAIFTDTLQGDSVQINAYRLAQLTSDEYCIIILELVRRSTDWHRTVRWPMDTTWVEFTPNLPDTISLGVHKIAHQQYWYAITIGATSGPAFVRSGFVKMLLEKMRLDLYPPTAASKNPK